MRELLFSITKKDFELNYFSGTGAGGQHRNKHQNCVRLRHTESGVTSVGQSHRERLSNLREALQNLVKNPRFKVWHTGAINAALGGKDIEAQVDEMMREKNLKIEVQEDGKWLEWYPGEEEKP